MFVWSTNVLIQNTIRSCNLKYIRKAKKPRIIKTLTSFFFFLVNKHWPVRVRKSYVKAGETAEEVSNFSNKKAIMNVIVYIHLISYIYLCSNLGGRECEKLRSIHGRGEIHREQQDKDKLPSSTCLLFVHWFVWLRPWA